MDTMEIVVYLAVAVLVGGMILLATTELANAGIFEKISNTIKGKETAEFTTLNNETIAPFLFSTWQECGLGTKEMNVTFQYQGDEITLDEVFDEIQRMRLCRTLSSLSRDCGSREDVVLLSALEAGIHTARCQPETQQMIIE